jgi:hypothetical protein
MTTRLDKPIVRELTLTYEGRQILLEILPGDPTKGELETFRFRLKGTSATKHVRSITVRQVLESLGWPIKVKIPKTAAAAGVVMTQLGPIDIEELERDLKAAGAETP